KLLMRMITNNRKERNTCQKKIIFDYLRSVTIHPSVQDIYSAVRKKLPRISRGTVYRFLKSLRQKGKIQEIPYKMSHYDGNVSPHSHFVCENCKRIYDVFGKVVIPRRKGLKVGRIKNYQLFFYGDCKNCQTK
ncbi:MAG: transcriptional repressor, partial [Patescibacteria group bacterium]